MSTHAISQLLYGPPCHELHAHCPPGGHFQCKPRASEATHLHAARERWRTWLHNGRRTCTDDRYEKQVPHARAVPLWGGVGPGGFGLVLFHPSKKVNTDEWVEAVEAGRLVAACKRARPDRARGPWHILCDNERFLKAPASRAAHGTHHVHLCHIPPRSPDLNPVELFWGWLRKQLRAMDLADFIHGRPPVTRAGLKARVRGLLLTQRASRVATRCFCSLIKTCETVQRKRGAASGA